MIFPLKRIIPYFAIIIVVLVFFYPVWFQGKVPLPADLIVGAYYPWLDYSWDAKGIGMPIKNPITSDAISLIFPEHTYSLKLLKEYGQALWNPLVLMGTPLAANFQSATFSPTKLIYFFLPLLEGWSFQIIIQHLLAALFAYLLLRELGTGALAATFGGIIFAFSGFMMIWSEWNELSLVAAFFPLIFFLTLKWFKTSQPFYLVFLAVAFALQIFAGYPQILFYELIGLMTLVFILIDRKDINPIKIFQLIFFLGLGIGVAAIQIVPGYELVNYSQRVKEIIPDEWTFLSWKHLITLFAPDFFGNHSTYNWWGPGNYTMVTGYTGLVSLILATYFVVSNRKHKVVIFSFWILLLVLLISFKNPLSIMLKRSTFLSYQAVAAHRSTVLINLILAILASFGLEMLYLGKAYLKNIWRSLYVPAIVLLGIGIGIFFSIFYFQSTNLPLLDSETNKLIMNYRVGLRNLVLPIIVFTLMGIAMVSSYYQKRLTKTIAILILALGIIELFRFGWKFTPFSAKKLVFPSTPVIEFLQNQKKPFRVSAQDVIPTNSLMVYGVETLEGYESLYSLRTARYLAVLNSGHVNSSPQDRYGAVTNIKSPLLDLANVRYIVVLKRNMEGEVDKNGNIPVEYQKESLQKVFEDQSVVVLENLHSYPRAKMYYQWDILENDQEILSKLISDYPLDKKIILEENPTVNSGKGEGEVFFQNSIDGKILKVVTN